MLLALSVISANGAGLGPTAYKVFDQHGGSIGRLESNDWSLPDPEKFVSSRHALLSYDGGAFYVEDTSTNGTFINGHDRPVPKTQRMPLTDGDRIFIGDYEILVQLIEDQVPGPAIPAPPGAASAPAPPEPSPSLALGTVDPLAVIGGGYSAPGEDSVVVAEARPPSRAIPTDWRTVFPAPQSGAAATGLGSQQPLATPVPSPLPPRPMPLAAGRDTVRPPSYASMPAAASAVATGADSPATGGAPELLGALGLDPARVDPAIWGQLGVIIRVIVQGMIEVLQSRAEVKNNFRMPMTSLRPVENNPLKFSLNADDALHNLFVKHNAGYLGPLEAFQEGFQDISFHQMAMIAGIRAAFDAMLAKLHPEHLEEIYGRKLRRTSMISLGSRTRFWEMYRAQFEDLDKNKDATFQLLFGEEFANAYNEQLRRLAAAARLQTR